MSTTAQIEANRKNSQLSTGPASPEGRAKSSLNAGSDEAVVLSAPKTQARTGLTGRTVLLPGDDAARYEAHVASFFARYEPATDEERNLVQSLADTEWRLLRIPALEMGIYAIGRIELAELFPQEDPEVRKQLIEAKILLTYQRQLNNLSIQENRLRRQREKDTAKLDQLQEELKRDDERLNEAAEQYIEAVEEDPDTDWEPQENGFEFSLAEIKQRAADIDPDSSDEWEHEDAA